MPKIAKGEGSAMLKGGMEGLMKQAQEMQGKFQEHAGQNRHRWRFRVNRALEWSRCK